MTLKDRLAAKKEEILERWFDCILEPYPPDTRRFFRENKSPFSNPVGVTLRKGMEGLFDDLLRGGSLEAAKGILESVMKVRAVEDLPSSQAVKFIFPLREVIFDIVGKEKKEGSPGREWLDLNDRINRLALLGMNLYSECREKVHRLRIKEGEKRRWAGQDRRAEV